MKDQNIKYVSFDVFGTLINRAVSLRQMFDLMGQVVAKKNIVQIDNFTKRRKIAEDVAREKYGNNYNLREIYQSFVPKLSDTQIQQLMELEREFEIVNSEVNMKGKELFDKYRKICKIIAISDMYLDADTIKKILKKNGYEIDRIYVSSEYQKSKRERKLYNIVSENLGVKRSRILHIGDALRSDWLNARLSGINSYWLHEKRGNYFYDFGFNVFGPVMYNFCRWINKKIEHNQKSKVLFVSREGEIIRKFYTALYGEVEREVIYLSRKSILTGVSGILLEKYSISRLIEMTSLKRNETFGDLLKRLGLEVGHFTDELKENEIKKDDMLNNVDFESFFKKYRDKILKELEKKTSMFNRYLQNNLSDNNLLIDIGWKGSMQDLLTEYLTLVQSHKKVKGLYLGCINRKNKAGFLFDDNNVICQETLNYSGLLETILMPEHGSVLDYQEHGGKIVPKFDKSEFSKESIEKIKKIQEGALDFIAKMREFGDNLKLDAEKANKRLNSFGNAPKLKDIKMLGGIDFYDNGRKYCLVKVDWRNLKAAFLDCRWKTAFLKQMLKINLPYGKMVSALRRKVDKDA